MKKVEKELNENSYRRYLKKFSTERFFGQNINNHISFDSTSGQVSQ